MQEQPDNIIAGITLVLVSMSSELTEREKYRKEQETIIEGIINDGNNHLLSLNYDIKYAKQELRELKAKLYELSTECYTAEEDLKNLREDIKRELKNATIYPNFGV